jgi:hypothetical protein
LEGGIAMKILHLLKDGPTKLSDQIISVESKEHDVKVVDLSKGVASYESIVDDIFAYDKVISW